MSLKFKNQHGFTLVEVLIAAFVLGIGLLGLAALQAQSLQFNFSAYQRSQATILAYDILDRIRANPSIASINSYTQAIGGGPPGGQNCQAVNADCTTAEMAVFDRSQWTCSLGNWNNTAPCPNYGIEGPLAQGDGSVAIALNNDGNGNTSAQITVTVTWLDNRTAKIDQGEVQRETFTVDSIMSVTQP